MSGPRMTQEEIWSFVTEAPTGIMTTLRGDGMPVALPLWFVCLDRLIYLRTRGKKLRRIANDSRASFLVESGTRWVELKAVHLTGKAEIVDLESDLAIRFRQEMDRKYALARAADNEMSSETAAHYQSSVREVVRFTPDERVLHWDNSKIAGS